MFRRLFKFGGESDFGTVNNIVISVLGFTIIIIAWHLISVNEVIPTNILPDPFRVIGSYGNLIDNHHMFGNA